MKICKKEQSIERRNGNYCTVTELPIETPSLNMATAEISGRYPESGHAINHKVSEMVYIQEGSGSITVNDQLTAFKNGDVVLVEPGDKFFWNGKFKGIISCSPAFTIEQHEVIEATVSEES